MNFDSVTVGNVLVSGSGNTITDEQYRFVGQRFCPSRSLPSNGKQLQAVKDELKGAQQAANEGAVKYDKNADGSVNKDSVTFEGKPSTATQDANSGKITSTGGSSLNTMWPAQAITPI